MLLITSDVDCGVSFPMLVSRIMRGTPTNPSGLAPLEGAANNYGHPPKLTGPSLGTNPLILAGVSPNYV